MNDIGLRILGALVFGFFAASVVRHFIKPTPRLANRVRPYTAAARSAFGYTPDRAILSREFVAGPQGVLQRLARPIAESLVHTATSVFGGAFDDEALALKLRQSGVLSDVPENERVHEYRVRQVLGGLSWGVGLAFLTQVIFARPAATLAILALGLFIGVTRRSARVSNEIQDRRNRMRIEIYTINQLLAMYLRTSGSPVLAAQRLVRRGQGVVISELDEALRLHARGMSASRAFSRIAETTPEPFAARTYKLLATGSERGADLASALLSLSEDVRDYRRTELRRNATKKQATMLVPILVFLAPVMLLFIAAPLPSFLINARG